MLTSFVESGANYMAPVQREPVRALGHRLEDEITEGITRSAAQYSLQWAYDGRCSSLLTLFAQDCFVAFAGAS